MGAVLRAIGVTVFAVLLAYAIWLVATPTANGGNQVFGTLYLVGLAVAALAVILNVTAPRR